MVHPAWQNMGLGTYLLRTMTEIAREHGFTIFRAYVWEENVRMLRVFEKMSLHMTALVDYSVIRMDYELTPPAGDMAERLPGGVCVDRTGDVPAAGHPLMLHAGKTR
jgi:GNAT superfamily N-acetyltransferase